MLTLCATGLSTAAWSATDSAATSDPAVSLPLSFWPGTTVNAIAVTPTAAAPVAAEILCRRDSLPWRSGVGTLMGGNLFQFADRSDSGRCGGSHSQLP